MENKAGGLFCSSVHIIYYRWIKNKVSFGETFLIGSSKLPLVRFLFKSNMYIVLWSFNIYINIYSLKVFNILVSNVNKLIYIYFFNK
ncbi:hypothetical protein Hanom_Chr17g01523811 [Helianthus anomalus]